MKNILVTGANGQLGNEMRVLSAEYKEYTCFFTDVAELDICDEQAMRPNSVSRIIRNWPTNWKN